MSLGNKKKVGIVQGLLHNPRLIILDEPTSGLDPLMQKRFFDLIRAENQRGATVLFSSHILSEVQYLCNRVAIIKDGTIIETREIASLVEDTARKVSVSSRQVLTPADLTLPGIRAVTVDGAHASFLYEGSCNELVGLLSRIDLLDVEIVEPSLEEVFMHYYSDTPTSSSR